MRTISLLSFLLLTGIGCEQKPTATPATAPATSPATAPAPAAAPVTQANAKTPSSQPVAPKPAAPHGVGATAPTSQPVAGRPAAQAAGVTTGPTSQPTSQPAAGAQPTGKGDDTAGLPPGHPPLPGADATGDISGHIRLDPRIKDKVKPNSVLFIVIRRNSGKGKKGMLLAAKKIKLDKTQTFPRPYTITANDVMMKGVELKGIVRVSARIDQDGDALSKSPGDITGELNVPFPVGSKGVNFAMDTVL